VAYHLDLPSELQGIQNVFHVSQLRQYQADPDHVVNDKPIELTSDLNYEERPIQIQEYGEKQLQQKRISLVKALWNHYLVQDVT
jgi:hypothetical protein